jgi:hypothetical protein
MLTSRSSTGFSDTKHWRELGSLLLGGGTRVARGWREVAGAVSGMAVFVERKVHPRLLVVGRSAGLAATRAAVPRRAIGRERSILNLFLGRKTQWKEMGEAERRGRGGRAGIRLKVDS